jgi:hypothetical protein
MLSKIEIIFFVSYEINCLSRAKSQLLTEVIFWYNKRKLYLNFEMKKVAAIFLTILYLIPSIGFSMDLHFCGSNVTEVSIQKSLDKDCVCGKSSSKCCKEIHLEVKLDASQKVSSSLVVSKKVNEIKVFRNAFLVSELLTSSTPKNNFVYYDPLSFSSLQKHPVYITNSSLLL